MAKTMQAMTRRKKHTFWHTTHITLGCVEKTIAPEPKGAAPGLSIAVDETQSPQGEIAKNVRHAVSCIYT